jgi:hypothetical protein
MVGKGAESAVPKLDAGRRRGEGRNDGTGLSVPIWNVAPAIALHKAEIDVATVASPIFTGFFFARGILQPTSVLSKSTY